MQHACTQADYSIYLMTGPRGKIMQIREISFYKQFKCTGGNCDHTCCRGWMIPLTAEDRLRFKQEKGMLKLALAAATSSSDILCFNKGSGSCPFHNSDGLCSLQLKKGHGFIPEACRMFPRFYRNYISFEEHYIDPACTEAARLLLKNVNDLTLTETEGDALSDPCTTNDDQKLLYDMIDVRTAMIKSLNGTDDIRSLNNALNTIRGYSNALQEAYLKGKDDFLSTHPFDAFDPGYDLLLFPMDAGVLRSIMGTSFYHIRLKKTNPFLYRLCRLYFDKYADIMASQEKWEKAAHDFTRKYKEAAGYPAAYYAYYLYLYFLKSYEDYSFLRNASLGMIHMNMIFMFSVLLSFEEPVSYPDRVADIISMYDRRACFNDEIMDEMYRCLDKALLQEQIRLPL